MPDEPAATGRGRSPLLAQVPASALIGYIASSITANTPIVVSVICIAAAGLVFLAVFRPKFVSEGSPVAASAAH